MFVLPDMRTDEIIMYLRKSRTDDPALTVSETVAKHEQMLDEYSQRIFGELIPEHNRFREIVSGETIAARPEMQKVLRLIEQPNYKAILIVEPQRLSRGDLEDIGRLSKLLRYTNTFVITLQYSYDLSDERDRDYFERELKRGNEFLEYSKRIMMNGRNLAAERGYYTGSRTPFGYKRIFRKDGNKKYPTLEIVQAEADIIRMIFSLYASGMGITRICNHLNQIGSKPKRGDHWTPPTIYSTLDNPLYIGKIKWGRRKTIKTVENGEITLHNPINKECPVFEGKHEAIINDDLWQTVQTRRQAKSLPKVKVSRDLQNPLSGIIYCSCGRMMIRRPYSGRCADRLQCPEQARCQNASCTMQEMIETISGILSDAITDFQVHIKAGDSAAAEMQEENLRMLQNRLAEIERKESGIWEKYAEGMPQHIFNELIQKTEQQKSEILALIERAENEPKPPDYSGQIVTFSEAIAALSDDDLPAAETNALLKSCIKRITYSRERGCRGKGGWIVNPMQLQVELNI